METSAHMRVSLAAQYIEKQFHVKPSILSKKEEQELMRLWKERGDKRAFDKLMTAHLFLVVRIAASFSRFGHLFDDLVQAGNIGLMTAIERFEIDRKTRLSTYALSRVRQSMREFLCEQGRTVPFSNQAMPFKKGGQLLRLKNKKDILFLIPDGELEECTRMLGITKEQLTLLDQYLSSDSFLSLNQTVPGRYGTVGGETFQDRLRDTNPSPEDNYAAKERGLICRVLVQQIFSRLSKREQAILTKRKMNDEPATLKELGK
ncbi:MAG: sigma-70 family RNA polymerase sigma factor, partial [bacterium]|nr:sigma-70 family RNA polymerase sigma factor [bacterium]